jgi:exonuclease SbcC
VRRRGELRASAASELRLGEFLTGPFRTELQTLEVRRLARALAEFERVFALSFQTLVEDPALIARTDGTFTPAVELDGTWTPAEALSGGERTALALAFRLALGHVVRTAGRLRLDTLILDEPTDGFSPEQVLRLGELLELVAPSQVLLVSHETSLASIADRVITIEKADGGSTLRQIGQPVADREPFPPGPDLLAP